MTWNVEIRGYAARWNVTTEPISRPNAPHLSRPARFGRGCFAFDVSATEVWFMHRGAQSYGRGATVALELWDDAYGLAFAFRPDRAHWSLVQGIEEGRYAQCSVGFSILHATAGHDGRQAYDDIGTAWLTEISICPRGACPGAICWKHTDSYPAALVSDAATLSPAWERSRAAQRALRSARAA